MNTVLVIDDTQDGLDLVAEALHGACSVVHGHSAAEGLALARCLRPDLILLDMSLPDSSGWEVAGQFRTIPGMSATPIIALTAHAMEGDRERCLAAGCDDYVSKPVSVRTLLRVVDRHLSGATSLKSWGGGVVKGDFACRLPN